MNNDDPMFLFKDKHKCCGFGPLQIPLTIVFKDRQKKIEWVYVCSCIWTFMENRLIHTFDTNKKDLVLVAVHEVFFSFTHSSYIMTSRYKRYITCARTECLSLVKHPEEHKEIPLRWVQGIVLVLGGMKEHPEKEKWQAPWIAQRRYTKGWYRPCVGWLELVLAVLLALDVLGWRTFKEDNNARERYMQYR